MVCSQDSSRYFREIVDVNDQVQEVEQRRRSVGITEATLSRLRSLEGCVGSALDPYKANVQFFLLSKEVEWLIGRAKHSGAPSNGPRC